MQRGLRIREDGRKWLVDLVRDCAGEFSEGGDPNEMGNFLSLQCGLGLGHFLFCDVNEDATEEPQRSPRIGVRMRAHPNPACLTVGQHNANLTADGLSPGRSVMQGSNRE